MPWDPVQSSPCTTMSVLFGLNETQSSPLLITLFWIVMAEERYVSQPSVFLAGLALFVPPEMEMWS